MSGWHPNASDGGLPPNPASPNNPAAAFDPVRDPVNTSALYYGNGCDVRLRPEVVNSLISENLAVVDAAELHYDPGRLTNLSLGVQYLIQRGLVIGAFMLGGPNAYNATLAPPLTRYNDFLTLRVVPTVANVGPVTLDVNGLGAVPILRNDATDLRAEDFPADIPQIIVARGNRFFVPYHVRSQVPILLVGAVDGWVRTDGNDATGDGTANTPEKAFRTIGRAFEVLGGKYLQTPLFTINIRLGNPGTYAPFYLGTFGGNLNIIGDITNPSQYRIAGLTTGSERYSGGISNQPNTSIQGVTFVMDSPAPIRHWAFACTGGAQVQLWNCRFEVTVGNNQATFIVVSANGILTFRDSLVIDGAGGTYQYLIYCQAQGNFFGGTPGSALTVMNTTVTGASIEVDMLSQFSYVGATVVVTNTHGIRYGVQANSVAYFGLQPIPGDQPGFQATGGQVL